jgi:hypothetical protein
VIRTGVVLPTFRHTVEEARAAADLALNAGIDGLFCFDHLWPMGQPERPALAPFPVLASLAASTPPRDGPRGGPYFGTLIARIGLVPNAVLESEFAALEQIAPGRVIAGLGTGDRLSAAENQAYGIPFSPVEERRRDVVTLARTLVDKGVTVWVAGGSGRTTEAREAGASVVLWGVDAEVVSSLNQEHDPVEVVWSGPPPRSEEVLRDTVRSVTRSGVTWVVFGWPVDLDALVDAARMSSSSEDGGSGS